MGVIDQKIKERDSWLYRFEEHRQPHYDDSRDPAKDTEEEIMKRRRMVGVFPRKEEEK
ncbi:MAG: hypothetical protein ACT4NX_06725 [Deltaproteobacteria bacterium]